MVINQDDEVVNAMSDNSRKMIMFSLSKPVGNNFGVIKENGDVFLCQGDKKIISDRELAIKGEHNIANALAAMALASSINVSIDAMVNVLKSFNGLEHRCQLVKIINGVSWYNDSKATNVGACIASIKGLCGLGNIILIAGGDSKGADLSSLKAVVKQHVKKVLLIGADANKLAEVLGSEVPHEFMADMDEAVSLASQVSNSGDLVLLAPACASLDMYKNYQQRGDIFVSAVNALEAS
jgi:UDP-N-acetylmuramoylalanine--D-glutamate ligase